MTGSAANPAAEAGAALQAQMDAWNHGDLEKALSYYWDSADITWVNRHGISFGRKDFAAAMRADFADRSKMGTFSSKTLQAKELRGDLVLLVIDWRIQDNAGKKLMGGVSSQLWQHFPEGWRTVFEHAS